MANQVVMQPQATHHEPLRMSLNLMIGVSPERRNDEASEIIPHTPFRTRIPLPAYLAASIKRTPDFPQ
jgi:hypothetical protein